MSWIRVRCELGHQQAILFRPPAPGQRADIEGRVDLSRPNNPIVIRSDWGEEAIAMHAEILRMIPTTCGVCRAALAYDLEPGDGPPGADEVTP